jgi:RimJ/RimL family protein N-acetyltransferase
VAYDYRGKGAFDMLYSFHRSAFSGQYDLLATEISTSNLRSIRAHLRVGFEVIDRYRDQEDEWEVVVWDWRT